MSKTNAIRILESKKIAHEVIFYDFNEEEIDAVSVARKIGMPLEEVFKTLVARASDNEILLFVIP
ncbi:MAG: Cys-tRNA(Pro) deacylase, partial [Bacteroidetes bacterium]|nr:Cys-tRNA(Pro) deacylase [Bacteroidota bacterium]